MLTPKPTTAAPPASRAPSARLWKPASWSLVAAATSVAAVAPSALGWTPVDRNVAGGRPASQWEYIRSGDSSVVTLPVDVTVSTCDWAGCLPGTRSRSRCVPGLLNCICTRTRPSLDTRASLIGTQVLPTWTSPTTARPPKRRESSPVTGNTSRVRTDVGALALKAAALARACTAESGASTAPARAAPSGASGSGAAWDGPPTETRVAAVTARAAESTRARRERGREVLNTSPSCVSPPTDARQCLASRRSRAQVYGVPESTRSGQISRRASRE